MQKKPTLVGFFFVMRPDRDRIILCSRIYVPAWRNIRKRTRIHFL